MTIGNWYRVGTVAVQNGSANVVGTGTFWTSQCNPGDRFTVDGVNWYEVASITDDTHMTILSVGGSGAFAGATASNIAYAIDRNFTNNLNANIAASVASLVAQYQANSNGPLSGLFQNGAVATPGIAFLNEVSTGWFHPAAGVAALAVQGAEVLRLVGTAGGVPAMLGFGTTAPAFAFDLASSANGAAGLRVTNGNAGTAAQAGAILSNGSSQLTIGQFGSNYTAAGLFQPNGSYLGATGAGGLTLATSTAAGLTLATNNTAALKIDSGQHVAISATPSPWNIAGGTLDLGNWLGLVGSNYGQSTAVSCNLYGIPGAWAYKNSGPGALYQSVNGIHQWLTAPIGNAGATATGLGTVFATDAAGNVGIGVGATTFGARLIVECANNAFTRSHTFQSGDGTASMFSDLGTKSYVAGESSSPSALFVRKDSVTGHSLKMAGDLGSGGNDYAEYRELIPTLYGSVAKGALLGYDATGLMTNVFANVVGRVLPKSTSPSITGGDLWGTQAAIIAAYGVAAPGAPPAPVFQPAAPAVVADPGPAATVEQQAVYTAYQAALFAYPGQEADYAAYQTELTAYETRLTAFNAALETERVKWDRIALCGVVPVNLLGVTTADIGKYLVPCAASDGTITATLIARADLTLGQYIDSFGTIEKIGTDGRPLVNVKNG